jgi:hypothetical protein
MTDSEMDAMIRVTILFEYYKRSFEQSDNPEMHFYVIPELRDTDNEIIKANAVHLIDENLVRGGVDDDGVQTFPWIRRITSTGMDLIQRLIDESESHIPELHDRLKDKTDSQEKILDYIAYCLKSEKFPIKILNVAKTIIP